MIFALCICIEKHGEGEISLPAPLGYMSKGGLREVDSKRVCLLDGHILCHIINLNFFWARNWLIAGTHKECSYNK